MNNDIIDMSKVKILKIELGPLKPMNNDIIDMS